MRVRDLSMMQVHNSKERELDEWVSLLKDADERLMLQNVVQPFGSSMSVLEVVRDDAVSTKSHINGDASGKIHGKVGEVAPTAVLPGAFAT